MKLRIINDVHLASPLATHTYKQILDAIEFCPEDTRCITLGDVFDFSNCRIEDVELLKSQAREVHNVCAVNVAGNHCLNLFDIPDEVRIDDTLFVHGDREFWSKERSDKFRSKKPGASWLKRHAFVYMIDFMRDYLSPGPNKRFEAYLEECAQKGIKHVVCGHRHPRSLMQGEHAGVKWTILPRGINHIQI